MQNLHLIVFADALQIYNFGLDSWEQYCAEKSSSSLDSSKTVTHIPPENWRNCHTKPTEAYDVYSFGIMMWEIFTDQTAFASDGCTGLTYWLLFVL